MMPRTLLFTLLPLHSVLPAAVIASVNPKADADYCTPPPAPSSATDAPQQPSDEEKSAEHNPTEPLFLQPVQMNLEELRGTSDADQEVALAEKQLIGEEKKATTGGGREKKAGVGEEKTGGEEKKAASVESSTGAPNSADGVAGSQFLQRALVEEMKQGSKPYEAQENSRHLSLGISMKGMLEFLERVGFIRETVTGGIWWMHTDKYTRTAEWLNETVGPIVKDQGRNSATGIGRDRT